MKLRREKPQLQLFWLEREKKTKNNQEPKTQNKKGHNNKKIIQKQKQTEQNIIINLPFIIVLETCPTQTAP